MCTIPATATLDLSGHCPEAAPGPAHLVFQSPQRPLLVFSFGHHSALSCVLKTDISYSEKGAAYMHPEFFTLHRGDEDRSSVSPTQPPYSLTLTYDSRKACLLHVLHARYTVDSHSQEKMVVGRRTQESSLASQFESNSSFVLSLLCGLTLTSVGSSLSFHG